MKLYVYKRYEKEEGEGPIFVQLRAPTKDSTIKSEHI